MFCCLQLESFDSNACWIKLNESLKKILDFIITNAADSCILLYGFKRLCWKNNNLKGLFFRCFITFKITFYSGPPLHKMNI